MELSDLVRWGPERDFWSVCDYTGVLYQLKGVGAAPEGAESAKVTALPRQVLLDEDGNSPLPAKSEWMVTKGDKLYVGGHGKEWVDNGVIKARGAEWVRVMGADGVLRYEDWHDRFAVLRAHTNATHPGYLSHEAAEWDAERGRWLFFPRKASTQGVPYDDTTDETMGSNLMIIATESTESPSSGFGDVVVRSIGPHDAAWGVGAARLLPSFDETCGHDEGAVMLLRVFEDEHSVDTVLGVFDVKTGASLLSVGGEDVVWTPLATTAVKFEGIAFTD